MRGWFDSALQLCNPTDAENCAFEPFRLRLPFRTVAPDEDAVKSAASWSNGRCSTEKLVTPRCPESCGESSGPRMFAVIPAVPFLSVTGICFVSGDAMAIA